MIIKKRVSLATNQGPDLQFVGDGEGPQWGPANQGYLRFGEIEAHTAVGPQMSE